MRWKKDDWSSYRERRVFALLPITANCSGGGVECRWLETVTLRQSYSYAAGGWKTIEFVD